MKIIYNELKTHGVRGVDIGFYPENNNDTTRLYIDLYDNCDDSNIPDNRPPDCHISLMINHIDNTCKIFVAGE